MHQLCQGSNKKPLEIYVFVDPLCPECWALEPILKKLQIEYGQLLSLKHVLGGNLQQLNIGAQQKFEHIAKSWEKTGSRSGMSCDGNLWLENPIDTPYAASIAIKAAGLQGKKQGIRFLRRLQEVVFLEKQNVTEESVLIQCAKHVGLDVNEFVKDLHSDYAAKAFQCDLKITSEMDVDEIPTLVFFNEKVEEEGIKISGYYSYETYVHIIKEMLEIDPDPACLPPLRSFLSYFQFVASKEVAVVYGLSLEEAEKELKKLQLQQVVERVPVKYGTFWRSTEKSC
ncbi:MULTISPECIES: ClpXP adapter SpxH family protein [Priestia]|uniref:ClpXP adapter protein SpxH n=4 Tax=Priestia TaxID=2800373 RepID=D5E037_PRIM1|nr:MULTISPECIES: ClpXP adapter SpxH family protein [Priestia]AVX11128.1 DsbA family protein [Bacillus sp. Y-01]KOP77464.1 dithiol-disulfide isomerase [Bacillus sp. FJAT-21351]KQU26102.1 dithiol-disulfide isomerase [Bacillus sp. Leaf75]KRE11029.1 dithiol-disulfide isomerase [Bacillus sp. Root239]KRF53887.1 dithiol-disulfide isomerase [Bacillus sp. Soil531]MBU8854411.1 DsbA family protein [Bacillus sp. FJAT-26377]MBZ5479734.1 DsbA family protein [Bacillus sp. T_4]MCF6794583.1 DsbA family prot